MNYELWIMSCKNAILVEKGFLIGGLGCVLSSAWCSISFTYIRTVLFIYLFAFRNNDTKQTWKQRIVLFWLLIQQWFSRNCAYILSPSLRKAGAAGPESVTYCSLSNLYKLQCNVNPEPFGVYYFIGKRSNTSINSFVFNKINVYLKNKYYFWNTTKQE